MKIKNVSTTILIMVGIIVMTGILIVDAIPGQTSACNGCHAYPPTTINVTTDISSIVVNAGQSFIINISWNGGNDAGTTEINWPTDFSNIGIMKDNAMFNPTPRIPASVMNTPNGTTASTLTAPDIAGSYTVRVYASRNNPWETDYKDISVTVNAPASGFDENTPITTSHGNITLAQIAEIQPGLGTVMIEYANRFWTIYYAAKIGNWSLAQYQLKEAREIQEVGETTRQNRASALKAFESSYLDPLQDTMNTTNWSAFQIAYNNTENGCNNCHTSNGFPFIKYTLPPNPPDLLMPHELKGDVDGNGKVDIVDALFIAQYVVGLRTLSSQQLSVADVDRDGKVDIVDALFIAQYVVGLRQLI